MILEAIMTADGNDIVPIRGFRKQGDVLAGNYIFQASSNGAKGTRDISNRSCVIRIRKRNEGYEWKKFKEGDLYDHVQANQGVILGAVHRVVREWIENGKPETNELRHSFRKWSRKLDWIMKNIFKRSDMMDNHQSIQNRIATPMLGALRDLSLEIVRMKRLNEQFTTMELVCFSENYDIHFPGMKATEDKLKAQWLGIQLGKLFKDKDEDSDRLQLDGGIRLVRVIEQVPREDGRGNWDVKRYSFEQEG
jgi:hypothetical protein